MKKIFLISIVCVIGIVSCKKSNTGQPQVPNEQVCKFYEQLAWQGPAHNNTLDSIGRLSAFPTEGFTPDYNAGCYYLGSSPSSQTVQTICNAYLNVSYDTYVDSMTNCGSSVKAFYQKISDSIAVAGEDGAELLNMIVNIESELANNGTMTQTEKRRVYTPICILKSSIAFWTTAAEDSGSPWHDSDPKMPRWLADTQGWIIGMWQPWDTDGAFICATLFSSSAR